MAYQTAADFPLQFLPLSSVRAAKQLRDFDDVRQADALLVYRMFQSVKLT